MYLCGARQAVDGAQLVQQSGGLSQPVAVLEAPLTSVMTQLHRERCGCRCRGEKLAVQYPGLRPGGFSTRGRIQGEDEPRLPGGHRPNRLCLA